MNTTLFSQINWLAVLVAGIVYFMIGGLWYSKFLFGNRWATLLNIDMSNPEKNKGVPAIMFYSFVFMLITVFGLALLVVRLDLTILSSAFKIGLITGFCFAVMSMSISFVYERKPLALYVISGGYQLVGNIVAAMILVMWR